MKGNMARIAIPIICLSALVGPAAGPRAQDQSTAPVQYEVINLGTLGGTSGFAAVINDEGWIDGFSNLPGDQNHHAFLWVKGHMTDLGTLGGPNSNVGGLNEVGEVAVGVAETSTPDPLGEDCLGAGFGNHLICLPFIWHDGAKTVLPTLGGNNADPESGFNDRGQLVGFAETATHDPTCIAPQVLGFEAVIWGPGESEVHELPPLAGDSDGVAFDINGSGQVVGASGICGNISPATAFHAVLWQNGSVTDLGNLGGTYSNIAFGINNRGQVVGVSDLPGDTIFHAFLWQNGGMTDLGTLPGDSLSLAISVNDTGQVVGQSCDANFNCRAFIWQRGVMTDLNAAIPGSTLYLLNPNWINARGQIVGQAFDQSSAETVPFLATPTGAAANPVERPKLNLPDDVHKLLRQRRGFGRFALR